MYRHAFRITLLTLVVASSSAGFAQPPGRQTNSYELLLHSRSLADQQTALAAVMDDPQRYVTQIQQSLRDYPKTLRTNHMAANRAVYVAALVRYPSFAAILSKYLGNANVRDECAYACPVVFALTIHARFAGWKLPPNLDSRLTTVNDLRNSISNVSRLTLKAGSLEDVVQGPALEKHRKELEGKTEEELIQMAGPTGRSIDARLFAAYRLETMVTDRRNRIALYLLALNEFDDASGEYRDAVYQSIYRAELANAQSESFEHTK